jgi:hypothetical protein
MLRIEVDRKKGRTDGLCPGAKRHSNEALGIHANHFSFSFSRPERHLSSSKDCVVSFGLELLIARDGALLFQDFAGLATSQGCSICQGDHLDAALFLIFVITSGKENNTLAPALFLWPVLLVAALRARDL